MSGRLSRLIGMVLVLGLTAMSLGFFAFLLDEAGREGFEFFLAGSLGLAGFGWLLLRGPVGKAIAALLEGGGAAADPMLGVRVADLEDRLQELTLETQRLMEIEDRLEFTERLIAAREDVRPGGDDGR